MYRLIISGVNLEIILSHTYWFLKIEQNIDLQSHVVFELVQLILWFLEQNYDYCHLI